MNVRALSQEHGFRTMALITLMLMVPLVAGVLTSEFPVKFSLLAGVAVLFIALTLKHPEVIYALFLTSGDFKGDPRLQFAYLDPTVFFGALTIVGIMWGIKQKRIKPAVPPSRMYAPFLVFCFLAGISLLYTIAPVYGTEKLTRFVSLTALGFFAPYYLFQESEDADFSKKFRNFLIIYIILTGVMFYDIMQSGALNLNSEVAIGAPGDTYLSIGRSMAMTFIIVFFYFFMKDRSSIRRTFFIAVICPAAIYGLMISGARGPLFALVATLVAIPFLLRQKRRERGKIRIWTVLVFLAAVGYFSYSYQEFVRMTYRLDVLNDVGGGSSVMERMYMAKAALSAMSTPRYLITGLGVGGFSVFYKGLDAIRGEYPHNILLEVGSEIGIFGLTSILLLFYWSFGKAYSLVKRAIGENYYTAVTILSIFIFNVLNALKSGDINDHRELFATIGIIYALNRKIEHSEVKGAESPATGKLASF